ncbi:MAG: ATP-binding protein [Pirellulaceae bacterium]|nr:ATP-binding protein [Pirellulaceae bacterium]
MTDEKADSMYGKRIRSEIDPLIRLFRAHRENDQATFRKAAESIIADELAANHHSAAKELRAALGSTPPKTPRESLGGMSVLRRRTDLDQLFTIYHEPASTQHLLLNEETKKRIDRFIDERRNSKKLARFGYSPKSKLLFWGPPGCGKTLTAHFLANQLNIKVGVVRLSSLISSLLGDTAARIQQVFDIAQESPIVVLFDEFDAVAKTRDDLQDVGELKRVVNSLLQAMDTFVAKESVLIGASNHQYMLDPAIWRRFDDVITFPQPSPSIRLSYITHLLNGVPFDGSMPKLGKLTAGLSFAEIEHVLVEAIKSMILADRKDLLINDIAEQLTHHKKMKSATNREQLGQDE